MSKVRHASHGSRSIKTNHPSPASGTADESDWLSTNVGKKQHNFCPRLFSLQVRRSVI
jgi:hypothetical protein